MRSEAEYGGRGFLKWTRSCGDSDRAVNGKAARSNFQDCNVDACKLYPNGVSKYMETV